MSDATAVDSDRPARRQQQRSLITQQKLLVAAIEAFSENGFSGTSTRDIAERAGVHHPLITYHFKNKEQLWPVGATLAGRLHGPAGLDIGGRGPAAIALSIVAQLQQLIARD